MQKRSVIMSGAVVFLFLLALPLAAQNASLVGTVKDQQGGVMPNVTVTLTGRTPASARPRQTDASGNYEFPTVRPGTYKVKVEQKGFQTFIQTGIVLAVDDRSRVDPVMQVGETTTVVTVEAQASAVQTESSSLGSVVDNKKIVEIPLNGRFFLDLALLQAGTTVPSTNNRTFLAVPSGIGISGINASGTREDSTNYVVDGINLSDMVQNQITFQPNIDMIQEFKVQTNAFSAEYGRNAGIVINGVSKSGTNGLHGTAYEFVRNDHFDAKNYLRSAGQDPAVQAQHLRLQRRRSDHQEQDVLLPQLRRPPRPRGGDPEHGGAHARAARRGDQPGDPETARPDPGRQRCHRHALRRLRPRASAR